MDTAASVRFGHSVNLSRPSAQGPEVTCPRGPSSRGQAALPISGGTSILEPLEGADNVRPGAEPDLPRLAPDRESCGIPAQKGIHAAVAHPDPVGGRVRERTEVRPARAGAHWMSARAGRGRWSWTWGRAQARLHDHRSAGWVSTCHKRCRRRLARCDKQAVMHPEHRVVGGADMHPASTMRPHAAR